MFTMLRLVSTSTVIPFTAARAIASPKIRLLPIANALRKSPIVSDRHFSTDSGNLICRRLVGALKSQIEAHELALVKNRGAPADLPFTIEDDESYCHIMLTRELGEEKIEVTVNPLLDIPENDASGDKDNNSDSSDCDSDSEKSDVAPAQSVRINVSISKENKGTLDVGANVSADQILVDRISFSEPKSYVPSLRYYVEAEGELQYSFNEFVRVRGIEKSSVGFLYNYMLEKRKRWGTIWVPGRKAEADGLKKLKKFVEDWHRSRVIS